MTTEQALKKVMVRLKKMSPRQIKRELKKHENGPYAKMLNELWAFEDWLKQNI